MLKDYYTDIFVGFIALFALVVPILLCAFFVRNYTIYTIISFCYCVLVYLPGFMWLSNKL
jgi:hypothetical protein